MLLKGEPGFIGPQGEPGLPGLPGTKVRVAGQCSGTKPLEPESNSTLLACIRGAEIVLMV